MCKAVTTPEIEPTVWARCQEIAPSDHLTPYVAHMVLRRLDWDLHFHPDEVERSLPTALRFKRLVDP
jgi:hypothetical protein